MASTTTKLPAMLSMRHGAGNLRPALVRSTLRYAADVHRRPVLAVGHSSVTRGLAPGNSLVGTGEAAEIVPHAVALRKLLQQLSGLETEMTNRPLAPPLAVAVAFGDDLFDHLNQRAQFLETESGGI